MQPPLSRKLRSLYRQGAFDLVRRNSGWEIVWRPHYLKADAPRISR